MPKNLNYELVRIFTRYGKTNEQILKTGSKIEVIELKRQHKDSKNDKYIVRPQIIKVNEKQ